MEKYIRKYRQRYKIVFVEKDVGKERKLPTWTRN
jgi:hypothetical protein